MAPSNNKYNCTRCIKEYIYKSGLTAHIKRKHPLPAHPPKPSKNTKPSAPARPNPKRTAPAAPVAQAQSLGTQDVEKMLEEEEFFNAVEELEHNVGINDSMVDWYGVNFQSSFTNTGEFANRTGPVVQPIQKCVDCKTSSETFEKQRQLLLNQDRQIQQGHQI